MRLFLACLFVGGVLSVPFRKNVEEICDPGKTRFLPNMRYTYRYVATSVTGVAGISKETTGHRIEAKCYIEGLGDCKSVLKLLDVKVMEISPGNDKIFKASPSQESFKKALEENNLIFTEIKGRFEAIYLPLREPAYVANIRRGILSALQLQFTEEEHTFVTEVDVSGNCTAEYRLVGFKGTETEITKAKNLSLCSSRSLIKTRLNPVMYDVNSGVQGPLKSQSLCRYVVDTHIKTLECSETHLLRPFSYESAGVTTGVRLNMTLESTQRTFFFDYEKGERRKSNLLYENQYISPLLRPSTVDFDFVSSLLDDLVVSLPLNETTPVTAGKFTDLVFALRKANLTTLESLWQFNYACLPATPNMDFLSREQCEKSQSYLVDAFAQCGSSACVEFISSAVLIPDDVQIQLKPEHVPRLLSAFNFVREPTWDLIDFILTAFRRKDFTFPRSALLPIGSAIRKYCQKKPEFCTSDSSHEVMKIVDVLEKPLPRCHATPETVDDVIMTLKGLGNAGTMRSDSIQLIQCALGANYLNVSVVALETIRSMPYSPDTWKSLKWSVFADYSKDPELRIQSYLALMKYPSEQFVNFTFGVLDKEINSQVGAFVFSHLQQMNESVEPTFGKKLSNMIRNALKVRKTPLREFSTSYKSRFTQKSFFTENSNMGLSSESSVIYHPESLIPRSAQLNVSFDLWGGAFPVLETNTRFEGLEIIWEKLFGDKGYFPDNRIQSLIPTPEAQTNEVKMSLEKRSVDRLVDIEELQKKVNLRKMSPSGFLSLKLFGNELDLFTLKDLEWIQEDDIPLADIIDFIRRLSKGINETYTKNMVFMEETYVIPTCLGIPLNVSINGTSVGSVYVHGKADLLNMFWGKKSAIVKGTIKPSASILLSGKVTFDAVHFSCGVQVNGSIWTSTELQGNITYNEDQGLKTHLNIAEKPQEILNISTALFHNIDAAKKLISGVKHRNTTGLCATDLFNSTKLFGLNLCSNISIPVAWYDKTVPYFPLTGPANFSIYLNKTDPLLTSFQFTANISNPDKYTNKTSISICTPRASYERKFFFNITVNHREKMQRLNLSIGTRQENASTIDFIRVPLSQALNITVNVTRNLTGFYFHRTCAKTHKIKYSLEINATLSRRSLHHFFFLQNDTHDWSLEANTTLWNTTKNMAISQLYLKTWLNLSGNTSGDVVLNFTHNPLNLTFFLTGMHNMAHRSSNVSWNVSCLAWSTPILNNNITVNMTYFNTKGHYKTNMNMSCNGTQVMSCYKSYVNSAKKRMTFYYCDSKMLNKTTSLNLTFTNATSGMKICHVNVTHQSKSITLNTTWMYNALMKNVTLNMTYLHHSIVLSGSIKNHTLEKAICFNSAYHKGMHKNFTILATCLSYVNATGKNALVFNVTSLNATATVNTTWFANSTARGILLNCTYRNQTVFNLTATYADTMTTKKLYFNFSMGNWSAELNHTFFTTQFNLTGVNQIRNLNITHKIKNGSLVLISNSLMFSFFNTSTKKDILFNLTFFNRTYGVLVSMLNNASSEVLHHIVKVRGYSPKRTVSWIGGLKNSSKIFNLTSVLRYHPQKVLNQTFVWKKESNHVNVSIDVLPNITVSFNFSGAFKSGINANANVTVYSHTILWRGHVSKRRVMSDLTLWNRTIELVSKTCNVSHSAFFNFRTWHHFDKSACDGAVSFFINATEGISYFNVSKHNVSYLLKVFSNDDTYLNTTIYKINGSEMYLEWNRDFTKDSILTDVTNMTSVRSYWKALNNVTFNIPSKLANIMLNVSLSGVNMETFRRHFKYALKNITRELLAWNYATDDFADNIFNLSRHLLDVSSRSIPNVAAGKYSKYFLGENNTELYLALFFDNLAQAIYQIKQSNVSLENVTEEMVLILQNFTDQLSYIAALENLPYITKNLSWFNQSTEAFIHEFFTAWLNDTIREFGNLTIPDEVINFYLKTYLPVAHNFTNEILSSTIVFTEALTNVGLDVRHFTNNVTEYFLSITHPLVFNMKKEILENISRFVSNSSFLGGVVYPIFKNLTEIWNISAVNFANELVVCNDLPSICLYPVRIMLQIHNITSKETLYESIDEFFNKTLAMYNTTVRSTSSRVNATHEWFVNMTDFVVMLLNDSVHVLDGARNKTTRQIIEFYVSNTCDMTNQLYGLTIQLLTSPDFSRPLNESLVLSNLPSHFSNWTYSMPWTRPILQKWNSTMFQAIGAMRKHSWQSYTRLYVPKLVKFTAGPVEHYIYLMMWFWKELPHNSTVNEIPAPIVVNYTRFLYDAAFSSADLTGKTLNFTRTITEFFLNNTYNRTFASCNATIGWTQAMYNLSFSLVNTTAGFINGSLVNETVSHYFHLAGDVFNFLNCSCSLTEEFSNYAICMVNQTILQYFDESGLSSIVAMAEKLNSNSELKAESIVQWIRPQNATAMTFGRNHFYTFDKRLFSIPSFNNPQCLFLIARDFRDGNFTIMASSNSITITTKDAMVKIYRDGLVRSQGMSMPNSAMPNSKVYEELPVMFERTMVVRDGPFIKLTGDLTVECDMEHFICSYIVSGFYHNRTAGLLGTINGEANDDWLSPSGKNRTKLNDFVNSWLMRGGVDCKMAPGFEACEKFVPENRCTVLFQNKTSPLSNCFSKVNPLDFLTACEADHKVCDLKDPLRTLHCNATAAYVKECQLHGIDIVLPDECSSCNIDGVFVEKNSSWQQNSTQEVDIVFVSSEGQGMQSVVALLPDFVKNLDKHLREQHNMLPQFGLVGFSSKAPVHRPGHVHTIKGRFLGDAQDFTLKMMDNIEIAVSDKELKQGILKRKGHPDSDGFLGLMKAAEYPFRVGAAKLFILITNSQRVSHSSLTDETVAEALKKISARLVLIGDFPFKKALAVDAFGRHYVKKGEYSNPRTLAQKDEYLQLLKETEGVAINLKTIESLELGSKSWRTKRIFEIIWKQIKDDTKAYRECICLADEVGKGKAVCKARFYSERGD